MKTYMEIAKDFGITERIKKLESELLQIKDVVKIDWDLTDLQSEIPYIIFLLKYDIRADRNDYFEARKNLINEAIRIGNENGLYKTEDRIEDYGEWFYFVFGCKNEWNLKEKFKEYFHPEEKEVVV